MKKTISALCLVLVVIFMMTACSPAAPAAETPTEAQSQAPAPTAAIPEEQPSEAPAQTAAPAESSIAQEPEAAGAQEIFDVAGVGRIEPAEFSDPDMRYRPGVRWWWPGNAASTEDLKAQVDYLADNGFGAVEIVAFAPGYLVDAGEAGLVSGSIYSALDAYDKEAILGYDTPEYYEKLNAVVEHANSRDIIVDLNMGSGYLANDNSVDVGESQSNMALGRTTISYDGSEVAIPAAEVSPFYASTLYGKDFGVWSPEDVKLNAVVIAEIKGEGEPLASNNQTVDLEKGSVAKTYTNQTLLDLTNALVLYPEEGATTLDLSKEKLKQGAEYEVIALYSAPAGNFSFNGFVEAGDGSGREYVVDHLDAEAVKNYISGWLGDSGMQEVLNNDIRAAFNDSYEFFTDNHYNDRVQELAKDQSILGYDITKYLPSFYQFFKESFLIGGLPSLKPEYVEAGMAALELSPYGGAGSPLLKADITEDEAARIEYDYGQLLNLAFQEGMQSFSDSLVDGYGILYRQQAYNPPIDTLKSAKYIDIPETEGLDEYSLKRASSGAHLYGKNLVASEVFTLGTTPFSATPEFIKNGYDLMATSGVNNFFYHGLDAPYYGNQDDPADDDLFTEEGWRAWPTIGVEMADTDPLSKYYKEMNTYAARANYAMQAGKQSSDVAVYMPLFGEVSTPGDIPFGASNPTAAIAVLQKNGYVWDAINDDTIQKDLAWENGKLKTTDGMEFSALVVESQTIPLETLSSLQKLADSGAPIVFFGAMPNNQPSYAGGDYAALNKEVEALAQKMAQSSAKTAQDESGLAEILKSAIAPPISYEANENIRFNRRTLENGELAYIRNTSPAQPVTVDITVDAAFTNSYWMDQSTGKIHAAENKDGVIQATLPANGAIILLCQVDEGAISASDVQQELPLSLRQSDAKDVQQLTDFTLEVTADNIGSYVPSEQAQTVSYTGNVLGNWTDDNFEEGALKYVSDVGVYTTSFEADEILAGGGTILLDLGNTASAATIYLNGEDMGQVYYAPFELDITDSLKPGTNELKIEVQPLKINRRLGLKNAYEADGIEKYAPYASHAVGFQGPMELQPAGLTGPVTIKKIA